MSPASSLDTSGITYDVFISHHKADGLWVMQELQKPLEDAEVKVHGEWAFEVGIDLLEARRMAVEASRHTLVVLTQDWCDSPESRDEALGALFLGGHRRVLPLVLKSCTRPLWLAKLTSYDFTANPYFAFTL